MVKKGKGYFDGICNSESILHDRIQTPRGNSTPPRSNPNSERKLHSTTIELKLRREISLHHDRIYTPRGNSTPPRSNLNSEGRFHFTTIESILREETLLHPILHTQILIPEVKPYLSLMPF